jgi:RNA polymerase sigma factor (sigma-70 family)
MMDPGAVVLVVDDDESVRRALTRLLTAEGYEVHTYASAHELLMQGTPTGSGCALLDVRLPGLGGLELQSTLRAIGWDLPIVFMTGHGDVPTSVRAMKGGAVDFLSKPFGDGELLDAIGRALTREREARVERERVSDLRNRFDSLTPREREVCALVVTGRLNKQIAAALGTSEKTIKVHRARAMAKMQARSLAELVRIVDRLGVTRGAVPASLALAALTQ